MGPGLASLYNRCRVLECKFQTDCLWGHLKPQQLDNSLALLKLIIVVWQSYIVNKWSQRAYRSEIAL